MVYVNRRYGHLKSVKLCASLLVKSLYTSDLCFDPSELQPACPLSAIFPRACGGAGALVAGRVALPLGLTLAGRGSWVAFPPATALLSIALTVAEAQRARLRVTPVPREMAFPVPKGESWYDHYVHLR